MYFEFTQREDGNKICFPASYFSEKHTIIEREDGTDIVFNIYINSDIFNRGCFIKEKYSDVLELLKSYYGINDIEVPQIKEKAENNFIKRCK